MKYLLGDAGRRLLESLTFTRTLYAFDYDGTLSRIVSTPEEARTPPKTARLMRSFSRAFPTAVLSGRSRADLASRLDFVPRYVIGNHGVEGLPRQRGRSARAMATCAGWKAQLLGAWRRAGGDSGISLEDKRYSLALHYRRSRRKKAARAILFDLVQRLSPAPRLILGKSVLNLVPVGAPHKGVALLELMLYEQAKCAFYIGDDDTDEDVFTLPDARIITARVATKRTSEAQFFIRRQGEMNRVLELLLECHRKNGRA